MTTKESKVAIIILNMNENVSLRYLQGEFIVTVPEGTELKLPKEVTIKDCYLCYEKEKFARIEYS